MKSLLPLLLVLTFIGCSDDEIPKNSPGLMGCTTDVIEEDKIYTKGAQVFLWAGEDTATHFNITGSSLNECQIDEYGLDRESIEALNYPFYKPVSEAEDDINIMENVIVLEGSEETRIYPYSFLQSNEVVNDTIDGKPVMIVFCYLADLAAVYTRVYCDKELTFAASGYTYSDAAFWDGLSGFLLWDRETESLWWPLSDGAVSGVMQRNGLRKHDQDKWYSSTWGEVLQNHPEAMVLGFDQGPQEIPPHLNYACEDLECCE